MLSTIVSKLKSVFDTRFAVSYLIPASVGALLVALVAAVERGIARVLAAWQELRTAPSVSGGILLLVVLVVLAYLLQAVSTPVLQFWEGRYLPGWLTRRWRAWQEKEAARIAEEREHLELRAPHPQRYLAYPRDPRRVRATRLGNALAGAEEYAQETYGLDGVLWWPRLLTVVPEALRTRIDDAMTPLVGLLNLATVLVATSLATGAVLLLRIGDPLPFWVPPAVALPLAWLCYRAAVSHAVRFGILIRVAFDFHRLDILRQMTIRLPESYEAERALWARLNAWIGGFTPPGAASSPTDPEWRRGPFTYAAAADD